MTSESLTLKKVNGAKKSCYDGDEYPDLMPILHAARNSRVRNEFEVLQML